jgi:hypothetical protein
LTFARQQLRQFNCQPKAWKVSLLETIYWKTELSSIKLYTSVMPGKFIIAKGKVNIHSLMDRGGFYLPVAWLAAAATSTPMIKA